jgi:hypothetical protein
MPTIPRETDTSAITDKEIWQECSERLRICVEAESENRIRAERALEFRDGNQWPDDLYNQRKIDRRPSLTINHTNTFCRRVVNNMRQQRPRIKVHPVADADIDKANLIGGIIRHIETRSNAGVAYDTGGESAVNIGWGYWRVLSEYMDERSRDQELTIAAVRNTFTVYMDPSAVMPTGEDQEWCIITEKMKRSEYKRQYPKADNVEFMRTGQGDNTAQWETQTEIRLAEYYRISRVTDTLNYLSNGMNLYSSEMRKLQPELAAARAVVIGSRPSFRRVVEWYKVNGRMIVDRRTEGKDPLPGRYIPVVRCEGNVLDLNGRVRRKGMVWDLMDPARMYNYWRTAETEQLALASKAPWTGQPEHFDGHPEWDDANQRPYSKLTFNAAFFEQPDGSKTPLPNPQRQPAIEVPAGFVQAAQGAMGDLGAVAGMPHEPSQDTPGSVISGLALRRREAMSDIGHFQYYDNQTRAIGHTGRILVDLIPAYYSTARMQRIIGEDGVPSMVPINMPKAAQPGQPNASAPNGPPPDSTASEIENDLSIGTYDIVMDTGPGYETKRLEGAESMIDLLKTPLAEPISKVGADLIVRNMDFAGASDLADRLMPVTPEGLQKTMESLPKSAQGVVTALSAHIQQLQQKLQEAQMEIKYKTTIEHGWMQVEREKTAEKIKTDSANNQTKQFDTHVKSMTARDVAEIKAGADLMGKHQDAGYEAIERKEMLESSERAEQANGLSE